MSYDINLTVRPVINVPGGCNNAKTVIFTNYKIMKRLLLLLTLLTGITYSSIAANGYKLQIKFTDIKDSVIYLAHYYAKPLPTIYKTDSTRVDKNGLAVMESKEETLGGIYMILLSDKKTYFEILLNNGDNINMSVTVSQLPLGVRFKNSPENTRFAEYVAYLKDYTEREQKLRDEVSRAKTKDDTNTIAEKGKVLSKELKDYRKNYIAKYPGTLLANIFRSLLLPEIPAGKHYLEDGKTEDTLFGYNYYKDHYWDDFDFTDDRLINTPMYDARLDEYFNKLVLPWPDSVQKEGDMLLAKTRGRKELFKYTLHWVTQYAQTSKVMGMDQAFVYFVENYHMKGDAYWMTSDVLAKYIDRAQKIAPNVIGNIAPDIKMVDINKKQQSLYSVNAKYTLLVFWSPDCGHCQAEIPRVDSVYKATLKSKGVKVYAVRTEGEENKWQEFIKKHDMQDWVNVYDPEHKSNYKAQYDVYGTPVMYLLDEKKIIRGKKLDYSNIDKLIDILEKKDN